MLHLSIAIWALIFTLAGALLSWTGRPAEAQAIWSIATLPAAGILAVAITQSLFGGRVGVDAIALMAMISALAMREALAGAVIAIMFSGGNLLEIYARGKAEKHLRALRDRSPRTATRVSTTGIHAVPADEVACGDVLLVSAGEILCVDGELIEAAAFIDEAAVTGEPLPVRKEAGASLKNGTVNAGESFR